MREGLPALRQPWISGRGDVEVYDGREVRPQDNGYLSRGHEDLAASRPTTAAAGWRRFPA